MAPASSEGELAEADLPIAILVEALESVHHVFGRHGYGVYGAFDVPNGCVASRIGLRMATSCPP